MPARFSTLDRYMLANLVGTFAGVFGLVISIMLLEHLPRLFEAARVSDRTAYIVSRSLLSLLPEYAGIGLLFGLYLGVGLTVRRLSTRGELDAIGAAGISPRRLMRIPAVIAVAVATLLLWTEGWLMPDGERQLTSLSNAMLAGAFGYDIESGQFIELGDGAAIRFKRVDPLTGELSGVFFRSAESVVSAARGGLGINPRGEVLVHFDDGQVLDERHNRAFSFVHLNLVGGRLPKSEQTITDAQEQRNESSLPRLLASPRAGDRAMAWSRLLWPAFGLLVPFLAFVLGNPGRGARGWVGLSTGVLMIVLFIRTAELVASTTVLHPFVIAAVVAIGWAASTWLIVRGEQHWGAGYVDSFLRGHANRLSSRWRGWIPIRVARHFDALAVVPRAPQSLQEGGFKED